MDIKTSLQVHGYQFDSDSEYSGKSDFDDEYYALQPPPVSLPENLSTVVKIAAKNNSPLNNKEFGGNSFHDKVIKIKGDGSTETKTVTQKENMQGVNSRKLSHKNTKIHKNSLSEKQVNLRKGSYQKPNTKIYKNSVLEKQTSFDDNVCKLKANASISCIPNTGTKPKNNSTNSATLQDNQNNVKAESINTIQKLKERTCVNDTDTTPMLTDYFRTPMLKGDFHEIVTRSKTNDSRNNRPLSSSQNVNFSHSICDQSDILNKRDRNIAYHDHDLKVDRNIVIAQPIANSQEISASHSGMHQNRIIENTPAPALRAAVADARTPMSEDNFYEIVTRSKTKDSRNNQPLSSSQNVNFNHSICDKSDILNKHDCNIVYHDHDLKVDRNIVIAQPITNSQEISTSHSGLHQNRISENIPAPASRASVADANNIEHDSTSVTSIVNISRHGSDNISDSSNTCFQRLCNIFCCQFV